MKRRILLLFLIIFIGFSSFSLLKFSVASGIASPLVVISNYNPGAINVDYTITFTTDTGKKLSAGDVIDITFLHAFNFPSYSLSPDRLTINNYQVSVNSVNPYFSSPDPDDYWVSITVPSQITNADTITITIKGLTNPSIQTTWSETNHYENNPAINQWRLKVYTSRDESAWSQPYTVSLPSVSNVKNVVSPDTVGDVASYTVSFKTGTNGELHGGSSTITVLFPNGTILPSVIPVNSITVKVGSNQAIVNQQITPSGQMVTFYLPGSIYAGNNTDVQVIFSSSAGIKNPLQSGNQYFVQVQTSSDTTLVSSDYYSISSSKVSNVDVSLTNNTVNSPSGYTISFKTSSSGVLTKNSSYINIIFPVGTYLSGYILKSYVDVDGVQLNDNATIEGYTVKFKAPKDVGGLQTVTVTISPSAGIKNPSVPKSDYKISVFTTSDPGEALSNTYSIIESSIAPATVNVEPKVVNLTASYVINFTLGSSGTLSQGDEIYITFPTGTVVPLNIPQTSISINGIPSFKVPSVSQNTITVYASQFLSANSSVIIVITQQAGVKNSSTPSQNYKLSVSTKAEKTPVQSNPYAILDTVKSSVFISPSPADGKNGYYVSSPKVKIEISNPANIGYSVYYKIDSSNFTKYTSGTEITIPEGNHVFAYYTEDVYGNKEQVKEVQFKVDLTKPSLIVTSPENNSKLKTNTFEIKGSTEPGAQVTINDKQAVVNTDGSFSYIYSFSKEGTEEIKVKSEDIAGNFNENVLTLTYTKQVRIMIQVGNEHCYVNDEDFLLKGTAPYIKNGRVMVPIRFVSEALGFRVEWDPIFKIVSVYVDSKRIRLQVSSKTADLFGKAYALDSPPEIVNNTTFVPLRFISENFGATVTWDDKLQIVRIVYPKD
jgi:hypothetical protein